MKKETFKKVFSVVLCTAFASALFPSVVAFAGNVADTPFFYDIDYQQSADTMQRPKLDATSSYILCSSNTGTATAQSNGIQMGTVYTWGPEYPVGIGYQYLTNWVWENRPQTNVAAYCFFSFHNKTNYRAIHTEGLWSPDSV
ncbi:MAG: hypothetical protein LBG81_09065 [Coriobacteriaceae bacterium]|jgi:hypothetical protein|nr:hypothetical protein [Coriobacteriaceae bacterium]